MGIDSWRMSVECCVGVVKFVCSGVATACYARDITRVGSFAAVVIPDMLLLCVNLGTRSCTYLVSDGVRERR